MTGMIWFGAEISGWSAGLGKVGRRRQKERGTQSRVRILKGQIMEKLSELNKYISGKLKLVFFPLWMQCSF